MIALRATPRRGRSPLDANLRAQLQQTLGDAYHLERELGGGGMSRVFVANEQRLDRKVVVKVLAPDLAQGISVERFEREIRTVAALQQANIVPVLTAGDTNGLPFYTMPFVEGESLRARLGQGPLAIAEVVSILRDVARALAYAHGRGVVHRDIKPDNVLISGGAAVVTDFGIAKAISAARTSAATATLTQVGTSIGTPAYMAPEQAAGDSQVDHRADLYSFGAMAYELLTGQVVFADRSPQRMLAAHLSETPRPVTDLRPETPGALAELVMQCLAKEPSARPQDAGAALRALETTTDAGLAAMPPILLGGPGMFRKALAIYALACVAVAVLAKAAIVGVGLPDWVLAGSLLVMALGLPVILWTGYVQRVTRRVMARTPTFTPGGTPSAAAHGTMATMALKAAPHVSWYKTARGGMYAISAFIVMIAAFMAMRQLGIGPFGSLMGAGTFGERERVILAEFAGPASDSTLGPTVTEAFRTDIGQSANLSVMPSRAVREVLLRMQKPESARVDFALAREIATREGMKAVIDGDIVTLGGGYVLSVRLVAAQTGEDLGAFRETAADASEIIPAISRLSKALRTKVGESLRRVQNTRSLEKVSTGSLAALRKYTAAAKAYDEEGDFDRARQLYEEAIALDTNFAMAYRRLAVIMSNARVSRDLQIQYVQKAYDLRDRLSEAERYNAIAYYWTVGPNPDEDKTAAAYEGLLQVDSNDVSALNNLALVYDWRRDSVRAEQLWRRAIHVDPSAWVTYRGLASVLRRQGRFQEADSVIRAWATALPRQPNHATVRAGLRYETGDLDGSVAILDSLQKARPADGVTQAQVSQDLSNLAELQGQLARSRQISSERSADRADANNPQALLNVALRQSEYEIWYRSDTAKAKAEIDRALTETPIEQMPAVQRPYVQLASAYARVGRVDLARASLREYETSGAAAAARGSGAALQRALGDIAMAEGRYDVAVREYRAGDVGACRVCALPNIAWAYDLAGNADSAIALLSRYTAGPERPLGTDRAWRAGSHKRLGELYEARGDRVNAAEHYRKFIDLWKNADPELQPRVAEARRRLQELTPVEPPRR